MTEYDEPPTRRWRAEQVIAELAAEHGCTVEHQKPGTVEHYDEHGNLIAAELITRDGARVLARRFDDIGTIGAGVVRITREDLEQRKALIEAGLDPDAYYRWARDQAEDGE